MKVNRPLFLASALTAVFFFACKSNHEEESSGETSGVQNTSEETSNAETTSNLTSSAVVVKKNETRKFLRTAELKFKAKNVAKTTYAIENITNKLGGFVTYTNLQSSTSNETTNKINADSSVVTTYFKVENEMILRVPDTKLDSTLKSITPLVDHLDFRIVKADDVSLKLLANEMAQKRAGENSKRLANDIDSKGKKLTSISDAEDKLDSKKEQADNAKLENLAMNDQIEFSTVNIAMYQRQEISRELIPNDNIDKYQQSLASRMLDSLQTGWEIIAGILVFFTQLWGLILITVLLYFGYKKYRSFSIK